MSEAENVATDRGIPRQRSSFRWLHINDSHKGTATATARKFHVEQRAYDLVAVPMARIDS